MKRGRKGGRDRLPSRKLVGVIAEDTSDINTIDILIRKIAHSRYSIKSFKGDGCGKIIGKCRAWSQNLFEQGCRYLLIFHDLDKKDIAQLRAKLASALGVCPIERHLIVIPVEEIEAWLLADHAAITATMNLKTPQKAIADPENIRNPKERLARLVYEKSRHARRYINTVDNVKIASALKPENLMRCRSFVPFYDFIRANIR
jgi:hypothetical protein